MATRTDAPRDHPPALTALVCPCVSRVQPAHARATRPRSCVTGAVVWAAASWQAEIEAKKKEFVTTLAALKKSEAANVDKIDNLQILMVATRDWQMGKLETLDCQIARLANERKKEVDGLTALVAAADAAAAEE